MELEKLEKSINYKFKNINLLKQALTHSSYAYEHGVESYEKLEFLGDSILEFISSDYLFKNYKLILKKTYFLKLCLFQFSFNFLLFLLNTLNLNSLCNS